MRLAPAPLLCGVVLVFLQCVAVSLAAESKALHVAVQGDDTSGDGSATKPFATLAKAVGASRQLKTAEKQIVLHGGKYFNCEIVLNEQDSGLIIDSAPGEKPILYGGMALGAWTHDGDQLATTQLPALRQGQPDWQIRMLLVDGEMRPRARLPQHGSLTHLSHFDVPWMSTTAGGWKRKPTQEELATLKYKAGDLAPTFEYRNAEITVFHQWDESCTGISAHDASQQILTLSPACGHPPGAFGVQKYVLWNTREGLQAPGEWYFDRVHSSVVYWPLKGQDMNRAEVVAPVTACILRIHGTKKTPVKAVAIHGLTFSVTHVPLITAGFAADGFEGAITLEHTENCVLSGITVAHVAGHGISTRDSNGTVIENCEIASCGAGGIYAGGEGTVIANNHVHSVGILFASAVGIYRGGKGNLISHNEIHDCSYSAVNYGGQSNKIEENLIYDCMKVLHDGAAIYMFGARECTIKHNLVRDVAAENTASAYYLDEQSQGCLVEDNISVRSGWPAQNHMAHKNSLKHNLFIAEGDLRVSFPRCADYSLEQNVFYATGAIRIENPDAVTHWARNLFFSMSGKIEGVTLSDYSKTGTSEVLRGDTLEGDPLFENWTKGIYRFKTGSPAEKQGIEPLDASGIGRRTPRARRLL